MLSKHGLLQYPLIEDFVRSLGQKIERIYGAEVKSLAYAMNSTIDVDHIYAYKEKPLHTRIGSWIKDLVLFRWQRFAVRMRDRDPYDVFDQMASMHLARQVRPSFFILTAERAKYDRSLSPSHPAFISTVHHLSKAANIGLHPSYASARQPARLAEEKKELESILNKPVIRSRQHFLRLEFPKTYRELLRNGIREDYTMGYAEEIGFRAGTSRPFLWYDLEADELTPLRIIPFCVMDVTLKNYKKYKPSEAVQECKQLISDLKRVGGQFCLIWHNSSFYELEGWGDWDKVYEKILDCAVP